MAGKCEELTIVTTGEARYLGRAEAAEFLTERGYKTAPSTLAKKAVVGGGPPFVSWGRKPLYDPATLLEWAQRRCTGPRRSTSDRCFHITLLHSLRYAASLRRSDGTYGPAVLARVDDVEGRLVAIHRTWIGLDDG